MSGVYTHMIAKNFKFCKLAHVNEEVEELSNLEYNN